jgi:methyl-accepting chemotaxis protein
VDEIAVASNEQTKGLDQVNAAIREIDRVTQQTAASSEEAASASEELSAQAEYMKKYVDDLDHLVSGGGDSGAGPGKVGSPSTMVRTVSKKSTPALIAPSAAKAGEKSASSAKKPKAIAAPASRKKTGKDVIPFDEDAFEDF